MEDWTRVISFTYPHEAHMAKGVLEASGIEVIMKDESTVQVHNFLSNAIGGVKIFVENSKVEEALLVLENAGYIQKNEPEKKEALEVFSSEYKDQCPYCKSTNTAKKKEPGYLFALSILLLSFPFPFLNKKYYCYDCSKEWKVSNKK